MKTWNHIDHGIVSNNENININKLSYHEKILETIKRFEHRQVIKREIKILIENFVIDCD